MEHLSTQEPPLCSRCLAPLELHQPDPMDYVRFLGVCPDPGCGVWHECLDLPRPIARPLPVPTLAELEVAIELDWTPAAAPVPQAVA